LAKGGGKQTTSTTVPKEFRPYYTEAFGLARDASGKISGNPYPGPFVAPIDPNQTAGVESRTQALSSLSPTLGQSTVNLGESMARGDFLDPNANRFFAPAVQVGLDQASRTFNEQVLPRLMMGATTSGAYGGSRYAIAQEMLARDLARQLNEAATQAYAQNYANERQLQLQAPTLIQRGVGLTQLPGALRSELGDYSQSLAQRQIEGQIAAFQEKNAAPMRPLAPYLSVLSLTPGQQTTTKASGGGSTMDTIMSALTGSALLKSILPTGGGTA
jgi:hypothetical protein